MRGICNDSWNKNLKRIYKHTCTEVVVIVFLIHCALVYVQCTLRTLCKCPSGVSLLGLKVVGDFTEIWSFRGGGSQARFYQVTIVVWHARWQWQLVATGDCRLHLSLVLKVDIRCLASEYLPQHHAKAVQDVINPEQNITREERERQRRE